jgi:uncharacterized OB-fold protein
MALGETAPDMGVTGAAVPVREGLFTDTAPPRLLGSRCTVCGRHHFPRQDTCPYCTAEGAAPVELSGTGRLWSWTTVTSAPPGYHGDVPYGFGVVELPEGLRVIARLTEIDSARLSAGEPMELVVVPVRVLDGRQQVVTYAFAPRSGS